MLRWWGLLDTTLGPFTSSDCNDAARSVPNQLHRLCTVLFTYSICKLRLPLNYLLLGDPFVTDSRATSLQFWSHVAIASQSLYVNRLLCNRCSLKFL